MAGQNGGARPGAGRKKTSDRNAGAVVKAEKKIRDRLPEVIDALFELAIGVTVEEVDGEGARTVYTKAPDAKAAIYLTDRIMGKPTERTENETDATVVIHVKRDRADYPEPAPGADGDPSQPEDV